MKFLGILMTLLGGQALWAADPSGLIVLDFQSKGILDRAVLRQLWERTYEIASGFPKLDLVSSEEAHKRIFDQNVLVASRCDEACYQRVAQKLSVRELLVPTVEKVGDQLKFTFTRILGSNGQKTQEISIWSDGRIGRALSSGLFRIFSDEGKAKEFTIPPAAWKAAGILGVGLGGVLLLGLEQDRSPAPVQSPPPVPLAL